MQGNNSEREPEAHLLTDLIIKHVQQDDKYESMHKMYIHVTVLFYLHATVFQQHRPIQLVDQNKTRKKAVRTRAKTYKTAHHM